MWIRRNNIFTRNGQTNGIGPTIQSPNSSTQTFNPNNRRYRTCCCHCKTFTLSFGMIELFLICFILVAISPDFNNKYCTNHSKFIGSNLQIPLPPPDAPPPPQPSNNSDNNNINNTNNSETKSIEKKRRKRQLIDETVPIGPPPPSNVPDVMALIGQKSSLLPETQNKNVEISENKLEINKTEENQKMDDKEDFESETWTNDYQKWLKQTTCSLTIFWLVWIILHMFSIGLMCYGVRRQLWPLLIPHIIFRISWIILIFMVIASIISSFFYPAQNKNIFGQIILCIFLLILSLIISIFVKSEICCIEFVKRSVETGFSISNTRPFAPPSTASQSDGGRPEHVRRVVHTSIRKLPGPNAKRYQQNNNSINQIKKKNSSFDDETNINGSQMTMSTLAAVGNGITSSSNSSSTTRPSTAGSINRSGVIKGNTGNHTPSRVSSAEERKSTPLYTLNSERETNFGEEVRVINGSLPPLRHTYKV